MKLHFDGIGAAFYPDQQPRDTWEKYIELMASCDISFVRMAEFAWDKLEPSEGRYDFGWLDEVMTLLDRKNIRTVLCTPGATPPVWLCNRYDIYPTFQDGTRHSFGSRRYVCPNSPDFRMMIGWMIAAMATHYAHDDRVCGWQIDNEIGHPFCYCPRCLQEFQHFCQHEFGSISNFNDTLATHFWGQTLQSFDQLLLPNRFKHPALRLLYHRFYSRSVIDCFGQQAESLRQHGVTAPISTNYMVTWYGYDHEEMATHLDYCSGDYYFGPADIFGKGIYGIAFAAAYLRGMKPQINPRFNEFRAGKTGGMPWPGEIRCNAMAAVGLGADHISFFRWDTCSSGEECDDYGIVRRLERPGRCFDEIAGLARDLHCLRDRLDGTRPVPARTAFLYSTLSHYDIGEQAPCPDLAGPSGNGYPMFMARQFEALMRLGELPDIIFPGDDFSRYKLLIAPALIVLDAITADKVRAFIADGGIFLMLPVSGHYDRNDQIFPQGAVGPLADIFGISLVDYGPCPENADLTFVAKNYPSFAVSSWVDEIVPAADTVILGRYSGTPSLTGAAFTVRNYGQGRAFYLGTWAGSIEEMTAFYRAFYRQNELESVNPELPSGVFRFKRTKPGTEIEFLINGNPVETTCNTQILAPGEVRIEFRQEGIMDDYR